LRGVNIVSSIFSAQGENSRTIIQANNKPETQELRQRKNHHRILEGIIVPLVTPLRDYNILDKDSLASLLEHVISGGVHGIFILGTTGEGPSLSYRIRREVIRITCDLVNGKIPVLAGISDTSVEESLNLACFARDAGVDAVVIAPPYYFPADQAEILEYFSHIAPRLPLPFYIYNMPSHTKVQLEVETVDKMMTLPGCLGLKDSSGDMAYFRKLQDIFVAKNELSLFMGPEELLADALLAGCQGGVNGGANMFPQLYVELYESTRKQKPEKVIELHREIIQISKMIYTVGSYQSSYLKGLKCALACEGIIAEDIMAEPFHRFKKNERDKITKRLEFLKANTSFFPKHRTKFFKRLPVVKSIGMGRSRKSSSSPRAIPFRQSKPDISIS